MPAEEVERKLNDRIGKTSATAVVGIALVKGDFTRKPHMRWSVWFNDDTGSVRTLKSKITPAPPCLRMPSSPFGAEVLSASGSSPSAILKKNWMIFW